MSFVPPVSSLVARIGRVAGPVVALALWFGPRLGYEIEPGEPEANRMAAVAALMAIWWLTEAVPLAVTALLPLVLFPLGQIVPGREVVNNYAQRDIFLFLGGFLVALAVEESGLHRRVALTIVAAMGDQPRRLVAGFMLATALLSMWTSNTATTMMVLPIAASVLLQADEGPANAAVRRRLGTALMLAVAYAATIGGMATLIGTPTNVAFRSFYAVTFPDRPPIGFLSWMLLATPLAATFLVLAWALLSLVLFPLGREPLLGGRNVTRQALEGLGPMSSAERRMLVIFVLTALLWIFREPVPGWGWASLLGVGTEQTSGGRRVEWVDDATVAMGAAIACFLLPSGRKSGEPLLSWQATARVPWGILFLFGGGLALAQGLERTGLDALLGRAVAGGLAGLSPLGMAAVTAAGVTYLSELTSNVACVALVMPVLAQTAEDMHLPALALMLPAALAASCGFMLPIATPPNAIVYSSGRIPVREMIRAGFWMNLLGITLVVVYVRWLAPLVFNLQ